MELYTLTGVTIPTEFEINKDIIIGGNEVFIRKRTEKGWTLDFVFNRNGYIWDIGSTFYYWGIVNELVPLNFIDNNLSFSFSSDGRLMWEAYRYSGNCDPTTGYTESAYISSGQTPQLCVNGTSNDFNITITFERNYPLYNCDIENRGGSNDLVTGWTVTNVYDVITGATEQYAIIETLSKKWEKEQYDRLGTLKIYLNGNPIYKLNNWEEVIPSLRNSTNGIFQIWGGGTTGYVNIHEGTTGFSIKQASYYEYPLKFIEVKNHYINDLKPNYDIIECIEKCDDSVLGFNSNFLLTENRRYLLTEDNRIILY